MLRFRGEHISSLKHLAFGQHYKEHTYIHIKHLALNLAPNSDLRSRRQFHSHQTRKLLLIQKICWHRASCYRSCKLASQLKNDLYSFWVQMRPFLLLRLGKSKPSRCGFWRFTKNIIWFKWKYWKKLL